MSQVEAIQELRNLLLSDDRVRIESQFDGYKSELLSAIQKVESEISDPEKFSVHLSKNKTTMIDILGPMMGQMIKKYVEAEIEKINEKISNSRNWFKNKLTNLFVPKSKRTRDSLSKIGTPEIKQVLLIERDSGLLLGKYSDDRDVDTDIIAGMFTAIKSFADTAFSSEENELEFIHYKDHKIRLFPYGTLYFAIVFTGRDTVVLNEILTAGISDFMDRYYERYLATQHRASLYDDISGLIEKEFKEICKTLEQKSY